MTVAVRTIRIESASANSDLAQLDARVETLSRALRGLTADIAVDDSQLEAALSLVEDIANNPPDIEINVDTSAIDRAFNEIVELEGLDPSVDLQVDTGNLESVIDDITGIENLSPNVTIDVEADGISAIRSDLDRLGEDQNVSIRVEAENVSSTNSEINAVAEEEREATIEVQADISRVESAMALISSPAGVVGAAALAAGALFSASFGQSLDFSAANQTISAQLGLTQEESARIGEISGNVYAGAWGESIDEVNNAIRSIDQNLGEIENFPDAELEQITGLALDLATAFDVDVSEATRAAGQLIRSGLATDAEDAFDIITTGFQNGANASDEFLDTLSEYSVNFAEALSLIHISEPTRPY